LISLQKLRHGPRAMTNQPFFTRDAGGFIPTAAANGPWDPKSLHGRVIVGLLAFVIEQRHGSDDFVPARFTVDMFRLPGFAPIEVRSRLVRDGLRIKVVEAEFFSGGTSMARASCQLLRKTENPEGKVWSPPNWDVPAPADIAAPTDPRLGMNGKWTTRPIVGAIGDIGPRRLWMSEVRDLVEGTPLTPFVRVAVAADRLRGGEPPRIGRHRDRRMLALRPAGPDRNVDCRSAGAAQADGETAAAVVVAVIARSTCDEAIQSVLAASWIASLRSQ
jgi:hypothetical protein